MAGMLVNVYVLMRPPDSPVVKRGEQIVKRVVLVQPAG